MTRFTDAFTAGRSEGRGVLFPYMMAGLFEFEPMLGVFTAMAEAGADGFEVGIPYADPLMDGPVIQEAGSRALGGGMTLASGVTFAGRVAGETGLPCAVMTYVNPVLRLGLERFADAVAGAGCDAVIVADLPVDESEPFRTALDQAGIGLVQFAAPTTTDDRLQRVVDLARPFVYGIAEMGVTGERDGSTSRAADLSERVRARSDVPLVFGVGIGDAAGASAATAVGDGVIVGSALVRRVLEAESPEMAALAVTSLVGEIAAAIRGS